MIIYTVYDSKAKYYLNPFIGASEGEALRQFIVAVNDPQHQFHQHAADFSLWKIGTFDPQTGRIDVYGTMQEHARAWELKTIPISDHLATDLDQHLNQKDPSNVDK